MAPLSPRRSICFSVGVGAVIVGLRLLVVGDLGTGMPFMDQWDYEALVQYRTALRGSYSWEYLFMPHVEHRLVWTNLWNLLLLYLAGAWDPMIQLVAQTLWPGLAGALGCHYLLSQNMERGWRWLVIVGALLVWGTPLPHENILWGFQSQMGIYACCGMVLVRALAGYTQGRQKWALAGSVLLGALAMGGGMLAAPLALGVAGFVAIAEGKITRRAGELVLHAVVFALLAWLAKSDDARSQYAYAQSPAQFLQLLASSLAWPNVQLSWWAPGACLPLLLLVWRVWRRGRCPSELEVFVVALGLWGIGNAAGGAWTRGGMMNVPPSRYAEFLAVGCWANALALFLCLRPDPHRVRSSRMNWVGWFAVLWSGAVLCGGLARWHEYQVVEKPARESLNGGQLEMFNLLIDRKAARHRDPRSVDAHMITFATEVLREVLPPEIREPVDGLTPGGEFIVGPGADEGTRRWQSEPMRRKPRALLLHTTGAMTEWRPAVHYRDGGIVIPFERTNRLLGRWQEWIVRLPDLPEGRLVVEAEHSTADSWLLLPREMTEAGYWVRWLVLRTPFAGGVILVGCLLIVLGQSRTQSVEKTKTEVRLRP